MPNRKRTQCIIFIFCYKVKIYIYINLITKHTWGEVRNYSLFWQHSKATLLSLMWSWVSLFTFMLKIHYLCGWKMNYLTILLTLNTKRQIRDDNRPSDMVSSYKYIYTVFVNPCYAWERIFLFVVDHNKLTKISTWLGNYNNLNILIRTQYSINVCFYCVQMLWKVNI